MSEIARSHDELRRESQGLAQPLLAAVLIGSGAIHLAVMGEHYTEWWLYGAFFMSLAPLQLVQAVLVLSRPTRTLLKAIVLLNGAVIATWIVSRTVGVPFGPDAGSPEPVGFGDATATVYEALAIGMSVWLSRHRRGELAPEPASRLLTGGLIVIIALTTTLAAVAAATAA